MNKQELYNDAPTGSLGLINESGYMNSELFSGLVKSILPNTKPSEDDPFLLILDNHISHCSLSAVELCRKNNIVLLALPPHASHMLQPVDKLLKEWQQLVKQRQLFGTKVYPFNPDVISEDDSLCAEPTRIELPVAEDIDHSPVAIEPAEDADGRKREERTKNWRTEEQRTKYRCQKTQKNHK
ncbi:hypothetical protein PR048_033312 [Dryococelus australis]|uniref:DDE-1 domain-containing protein n=1 Tax=Dryococelus australis TaxID=614101 RepID=A0ABQ9FZX8_9NEOP|nr:hypothetical protein PR048_033312 [Dryococelus australis]